MKTQKLMTSRNVEIIAIEKQKAVEAVALLQNVINEGKAVELSITNENYLEAIKNPEQFARSAYEATIDIVPTLGGRKMTREAVLSTYEFPDTTAFINATNIFKEQTKGVQLQLLQIKEGKTCINEDELNIFIDKCSVYITHTDAIELWNAYNAMTDSLNKLKNIVKQKFGDEMFVHNLKEFIDSYDGVFKVRMSTFNRQVSKFNA